VTQRRWAALAAALVAVTTFGLTGCSGDNGTSDPTPSTRSAGSIPGATQKSQPKGTENSTPNPVPDPGSGGVP
jgi:hypothetical protein